MKGKAKFGDRLDPRIDGFTPGIDRYLSNVPDGPAFKQKIMDSLARGPRIVYHGMVGASDLARAVAAAGQSLGAEAKVEELVRAALRSA